MKSKEAVNANGLRLWIAVLESGDEAKTALAEFAKNMRIASASFAGVGAFERAAVAYFEWDRKQYKEVLIDEQVEVLSFLGDVVRDEKGEPSLHAHTVLGRSDGTVRGGHFVKGVVRPTLEVVFTETPAHLTRRKRPELGLALIDFD